MKIIQSTQIILLTGIIILLCFSGGNNKSNQKISTEYSLEILNQDSVAVYSHSTGELYKCKLKDINEVLITDNL